MNIIPKVFHRVWVGGKPMPEHFVKWGLSWEEKHPDWTMKLWTEKETESFVNVDLLGKCSSLAQQSDILRYEILKREGGVYLDTDMECLANIDALIEGKEFFAVWQKKGTVSNAIFGGAPGHPVFWDLVKRSRSEFSSFPWNAMGPPLFTKTVLKYAPEDVLEQKTFIPYTREEYGRLGNGTFPVEVTWELPGSYAVNHRSSIWYAASTDPLLPKLTKEQEEAKKITDAAQYWHYRFELPWGPTIPTKPGWAERAAKRRAFFFQRLLDIHGGTLKEKTVLDLGCCQGYWSQESRRAGASSVLGVDACQAFVNEAEAVKTILGLDGIEFVQSNLEEDPFWNTVGEPRDITLFLGILYHLIDPAYVLKRAMRLTKETIVIDGEVTPGTDPVLYLRPRTMTEPTTVRSGVTSSLRIVPTANAIVWLLKDGGFTDIQVLEPVPNLPADYHGKTTVSIIARR